MKRHLKFYLTIKIFFFIIIQINAQKLSNVIFKVNPNIFSPNNDGFNDEVVFQIHLLQDREIKVKDWNLKIYNYDYKLVRSFQLPLRLVKNHKFEIIWNGKDEYGNYVPSGIYEAILTLYYDYGNITKTHSLRVEVFFDNFFVNLKCENPYITLRWNPEKKTFGDPNREIEILANYQNDFALQSSFSSILLNHKKDIIEVREWEKRPKSKILWSGKDRNKKINIGIFHYLFSYKSYENQIYQFVLPGLAILPFPLRVNSFIEPLIINKKGRGYFNDELKNFDIVIKSSQTNFKNLNSLYYQLYCLMDGLFRSGWNFIQDGIESLSKEGITNLLPKIPENQNCLIVYFEQPIKNFKFLELHQSSVFTVIPIYIDTQKPFLELELENQYIQPDISYKKNFQTFKIQVYDNTFIKTLQMNLYLKIKDERLLLKQWNISPQHVHNDLKKFIKEIKWYGDTIQNISLESLDEMEVELIAFDFADNSSKIIKNFFIDIFFKERGDKYIANIPLSKMFDLGNGKAFDNFETHIKSITQEYNGIQKRYLYIRVHSDYKGNDEENLIKTEQFAEKLYAGFIHQIPKKNVFYRGMGELTPYMEGDNLLREYRNNRIEIIISDQFFNEEKELF